MRRGLDTNSVLQAAAELADQEGLERITLASVAQKLQIRTPSLYNHVQGLTGLKQALACHAVRQLKEAMVEAAIGKAGEEALYSIGISYVAFVRRHPGLYEAAMAAPDPCDPDFQAAGEEIVALLLRVLQPYELEEEYALHTVRGLRSIVHGFASLEMRNGFNLPLNRDDSLRCMLRTYLDGLRYNKKKQRGSEGNSI